MAKKRKLEPVDSGPKVCVAPRWEVRDRTMGGGEAKTDMVTETSAICGHSRDWIGHLWKDFEGYHPFQPGIAVSAPDPVLHLDPGQMQIEAFAS